MRDELLKLHRADFGTEEEEEVLAALRSGWLTKGPRTAEFERRFAQRLDAPFSLGVNSCTAALHLALLVGGVGPGDEVIVPAITFAATANVVVHCGATPRFADVLPGTHCIDPAHAASLITPRTKAIIPVHFAGIPCDMEAISALAERHGLFVVEDCAHAIEAEYAGLPVGVAQGSRFAAYSFYATKNLICGEGGMLCCREEADRQRAAVLGLHGMSADAWLRYSGDRFRLYDISAAGFKYNMSDLQAALGLVQLSKLDGNWERRRGLVRQYEALIAATFPDGELTPLSIPPDIKPAYHIYVVRLDVAVEADPGVGPHGSAGFQPVDNADGQDARPTGRTQGSAPTKYSMRDRIINGLRRRNVEAYLHFPCLTQTQFYRECYGTSGAQTPVAASLSRRSITLPLFPSMTPGDVEYVVAMLRQALDEARQATS